MLPAAADERAALAQATGMPDATAFDAMLGGHRGAVAAHFAAIFGTDAPQHDPDTAAASTPPGRAGIEATRPARGPARRRSPPSGGGTSPGTRRWPRSPPRDSTIRPSSPTARAGQGRRPLPRTAGAVAAALRRAGAATSRVAAAADGGAVVADEAAAAPKAQAIFLRLLALLETVARRSVVPRAVERAPRRCCRGSRS